MKELSNQELLLINGGSEETYAAGKEAGQLFRELLDECDCLPDAVVLFVVLTILKKI